LWGDNTIQIYKEANIGLINDRQTNNIVVA